MIEGLTILLCNYDLLNIVEVDSDIGRDDILKSGNCGDKDVLEEDTFAAASRCCSSDEMLVDSWALLIPVGDGSLPIGTKGLWIASISDGMVACTRDGSVTLSFFTEASIGIEFWGDPELRYLDIVSKLNLYTYLFPCTLCMIFLS